MFPTLSREAAPWHTVRPVQTGTPCWAWGLGGLLLAGCGGGLTPPPSSPQIWADPGKYALMGAAAQLGESQLLWWGPEVGAPGSWGYRGWVFTPFRRAAWRANGRGTEWAGWGVPRGLQVLTPRQAAS